MLEILPDPLWQFVGAVISLLSIPTAFWIYALQRTRKEVAFGQLSELTVVSVADAIRSRVAITFDGIPVDNVHIVLIAFKNSGNVAILKEDFAEPVKFKFREGSQVLVASVHKTLPAGLPIELNLGPDSISFAPTMLNAGDSFLIGCMVSGESVAVSPHIRIIGVPTIATLRTYRPFSSSESKRQAIAPILTAVILIATASSTQAPQRWMFYGIAALIISVISYYWFGPRYGAAASRYIEA